MKIPKATKTSNGTQVSNLTHCPEKNVLIGVIQTSRGTIKPGMWTMNGVNIHHSNSNLNIKFRR